MELPLEGEEFSNAMDPVTSQAQFMMHTNLCLRVDKKQGTICLSLPNPFR